MTTIFDELDFLDNLDEINKLFGYELMEIEIDEFLIMIMKIKATF